MKRELWAHQVDTLEALRESVKQEVYRIVVQSPTGSGKTRLAAAIVDGSLTKGKRVAFVVPAISLVDQTVEMFFDEGIEDVGVIQADHEMTDWEKPVQVCSIQTIARRNVFPAAHVVIIDECHVLYKKHKEWLADEGSKKIPFIGLSATPYAKGLGKYFESMIVAARIEDLIEKGFLSKFRCFATGHPDLEGVKVIAGDYHEGQLSEAMQRGTLVADVVETWKERWGKDKTFVFGVDCVHAQALQARFLEAGITCGYQDARTSMIDRREIKRKFHEGEMRVLCNVGTLCLDQKTEILTDKGWVGIDGMTYEHRVAAWSETGVEFTYPLHIVRRRREMHEKMVSVEGRVHNIRVTSNHRMLWSKSPRNFRIVSAESLVGVGGFIPVSGYAAPVTIDRPVADANRDRLRRNGLTYKYRTLGITAIQAIEAEQEYRDHLTQNCAFKLPHDLTLDECMFIGFWIGDGTRSGGRFSVTQSRRYPGIIMWFDELIKRLCLHVRKSVYPPAIKSKYESVRWDFSTGRGGRGQRIAGVGLSSIMPYLEKNGSELLWGLNAEQFSTFLYGYWMADGNHGNGCGHERGRRIWGRSLALFDLLQAVGACRGVRIAIRKNNAKHRKTPFYWISWIKQTASKLVRERLRLEDDYRVERVWCVTSTTGNIITRRGGKVAVVGNTTGVDYDVRCLVLARPTRSEMLYQQIVGRALRTAEGKDHAVILDHSDTTARLGLVTDIYHDHLDDGLPKAVAERVVPLPKPCPSCALLFRGGKCPNCGFEKKPVNMIMEHDGELQEIVPGALPKRAGKHEFTYEQRREFYAQLCGFGQMKGYSRGWSAHIFRDRFGMWPERSWQALGARDPGVLVLTFIKQRAREWARKKRAERQAMPALPVPVARETYSERQAYRSAMMNDRDFEDFRP